MADWTTVAAIVGATTGPLSLGWNIYQSWLTRPRLKVEGELTGLITGDFQGGERSRVHWLNVRVTNIGKTPVTLTRIVFMYGEKKITFRDRLGISKKYEGTFSWPEPDMPKRLESGQYHHESRELKEDDGDFLRFEACTSLGRVYSNSLKNREFVRARVVQEVEKLKQLQVK